MALLALAPLLIGLLIARQLPPALAQLDQQIGSYDLSLSSFQRRWLASSGTLSVVRADGRAVLNYSVRLRHGLLTMAPGLLSGSGTIAKPDGSAMGELNFRLGITGKLGIDLRLRPASGLDGQLSLSHRLLGQQLTIASENLSGGGFDGLSGDLTLSLDNSASRLNLSLDRIGGSAWSAQTLQVSGVMTRSQDFADVQLTAAAQQWRQAGLAPFAPAQLKLAMKHLPVALLIKALELRDLQSALALLPPLLNQQPSIETLEIELDHPLGQARAALSASLSRPPPPGFMADLGRLMPALSVNGSWFITQALAQDYFRAEFMAAGVRPESAQRLALERWQAISVGGWLVPGDGGSRGSLSLANGELEVNGVVRQRW